MRLGTYVYEAECECGKCDNIMVEFDCSAWPEEPMTRDYPGSPMEFEMDGDNVVVFPCGASVELDWEMLTEYAQSYFEDAYDDDSRDYEPDDIDDERELARYENEYL